MESVDALIKGIQEYKGGVVLVSHDARLIASTGCELWVCEGGGRVRANQLAVRSMIRCTCQLLFFHRFNLVGAEGKGAEVRALRRREKSCFWRGRLFGVSIA